MATLFAVTYVDPDKAKEAMELVDWADFDQQVDVKDACWISNENGKVTVHPRGHALGTKSALGGGLGVLVGALFALPVAGLVAGAALGAHRARHKTNLLDEDFVSSITSEVSKGGSAIVVLYDPGADTGKAAADLIRLGGTIQSAQISTSDLDDIQKRLDRAEETEAAASNESSSE